jgi:GNAT superfamily N-acetyltransferase
MAILLHNLLARSPKLSDLPSITALFADCVSVEEGLCASSDSAQNVLADWHRPGFNLENDAWVITSKQGQVVSYADICMDEQNQIEMRVHVHPAYCRRGIGTLLLRLAEDRARVYARGACPNRCISLHSTVSEANHHAQQLLEQEGYLPVQYCPGEYVVYEKELQSSAEVSYRQALSSAA